MHISTQGLVLREVNYKESDKLLTVLTAEGGKRTVKARGCRRKGSPLAAAAQLLVYSDMTLGLLHPQRGGVPPAVLARQIRSGEAEPGLLLRGGDGGGGGGGAARSAGPLPHP